MKVGLRIIKTVIAVFISISIYLLLLGLNKLFNLDTDNLYAPTSFFTPFFAAIAAAYALHRDKKTSLKNAKIRSYGSIIGGYYGMIIVLLNDAILLKLYNTHFIIYEILTFFNVSIFIIPLILFTVKIKQPDSVFLTLLTYFSVTISIRNGGQPVTIFATNRILSTLIGIGISLLVNMMTFRFHKNKDYLFVSSLEGGIIKQNTTKLSPFMIYKLNNLYFKKMPLTFVTTRSVSSLSYIFDDTDINYPIVVMNGVAIYDFVEELYYEQYNISLEVKNYIDSVLIKEGVNPYIYTIEDHLLNCYYLKKPSDIERQFINIRRKNKSDNFVRAKLPTDAEPSLYMVIDKYDKLNQINKILKESVYGNKIDIIIYPYEDVQGDYYFLKINSSESRKEHLINKIKENKKYNKLIVCGSDDSDLELIKESDFSLCLSSASQIVKEHVNIVIDNNPETILKIFEKIYHTINFDKTVNKLKKKYKK